MDRKRPTDAKSIGACLNDPSSPVGKLINQTRTLTELEAAVRDWAGEPLAHSLHVANLRGEVLVICATSSAALTSVRYRQKELFEHLRKRLGLAINKLEAKVLPTAQFG